MHVAVVTQPLDVNEVVARVHRADCGGILTFVGTVRDHNRGRRVQYLEYEAYPEMAEAKLRQIGQEVLDRWDVTDVALVHRVGRLQLGETAVVIALAAAHRGDLFDACRYATDRLKE
ncbi:MAG: molybdenum cofactor biosynthesis protein MoaE, partial [Chloroflexi bacterium]|nr:molybdenum cofactor biosynthesis protein MoaE [Chloroflexota bacterium]